MTTPYTNQPNPGGGFINGLLGGALGTLAGTNPLQSSLDQLTNAVNRLSAQMSMGSLGPNGNNSGQTRQQNGGAQNGFPRMNNPFQPPGGGGPAGNISPSMTFSRMGATVAGGAAVGMAFAGYGQQQMPFQIGLNQYAANSMMGMSNAGMPTFGQNFAALANQPGMPITSNSMDYLQMMQGLSFLGGAPRYMSTALGRAGFGAAASFGLTNPALSGAMSANLAQQIYNPMLSMRMRMMGYSMTPRVMGSGMPQTMGNIASSLIQGWYGANKVAPSQLYKTLSMGGKGFTNLQYLGLNPQQMAPLLEGYNQLFNAGYSPQQASDLFSRAASNNPNVAKRAQATLAQLHVTSVSSDIQKLKNNQSQVTQRSVNTAAGFDAALTQTTDDLMKFNQALNSLMTTMHLNGPVGALGGALGVMSGTNHGNSLLGLGGMALMARGLLGGGGLGSILGGGGGAGAAGGMLGRLGGVARTGPLAAAAAAALFATSYHFGSKTLWQMGNPTPGSQTGWNSWSGLGHNLGNWGTDLGGTIGKIFGGAGSPLPHSTQSSSSSSNPVGGGVSSAAVKAVHSAESQLGVPYVWGGEQPGVGFDCSGLVQWAYRQAGVSLPRTSQQQWAALRRRSIPTSQAREGDLVFMAGSDGTPNSPGHVGMMINNRSLIEAPFTGQDVKIIGYDPKQWSHAARPSGSMTSSVGGTGGGLPGQNAGASSSPGLYGNRGMGMGLGNYGSVNEVDLISSTGGFMGGGSGGFAGGIGGQLPTSSSPVGTSAGGTMGRGSLMGNGSKNISAEKAFAMALLRQKGWANQFGSLNSIIMRESGWRWNAQNPTSSAYGIPQALPGSKMASAGGDWRTNPDTQLKWMIDTYIPQRYGDPNRAWQFWQANGWYGGGGWSGGPGIRVVGDRGPEMQIDTGHGTLTINNAQTMSLLKSISNPQQTPWQNFSESKAAGQMIYQGQPTGAKVNVTFGQQSICINVSSATDAQTAGQSIADQIVRSINSEQLWSAVAKGQKN